MASFPPLSNTQVQGIVVLPILPNPPGCTVQDAMGHPTVLSSGSVVRRGEGNGVVMLTGAKTYFGRTTELVQEARPKLHIEAVVAKVVRWLFVIVGVLLTVVIVLSLIRGAPLLEMVPLMLVLLMSAVPIALPVMFTVSMAVGSKELAKRGVLVTRHSASEDAATMDVLCVDKTGTITMNQLAVTGVIPLEHATETDVLFAGALASQEANQDPVDLAFLAAAKERHIFDNLPKVVPVSFAPFDAKNRRTEAVVEQDGKRLRVMKGAGLIALAEGCGAGTPARGDGGKTCDQLVGDYEAAVSFGPPKSVLGRHLPDQADGLGGDPAFDAAGLGSPTPEDAKPLAMPF